MTGLQKGLSDSAFKHNLYQLVDSLTRSATENVSATVNHLLDTLTSDKIVLFTRQIIEEATNEKLKGNLFLLHNVLLGAAINGRIKRLVETAVASALNDGTNLKIAKPRDELIGDATNLCLVRIRDSLLGENGHCFAGRIGFIAWQGVTLFVNRFAAKH